MKHQPHARIVIIALFSIVWSLATAHASDPLGAIPTSDKPVEMRVRALSAEQLQMIKLPENRDQVVFSVAKTNFEKPTADKQEAEPYFCVFADGRLNCQQPISLPEIERRNDKLSELELTWLLHLVVNECQIMRRTTRAIDDDYRVLPHGGLPPSESLVYYVFTSSQEAKLAIPENALIAKNLRAKLNLVPFASLNYYVQFLISRAYFDPAEREPIVARLNHELKTKISTAPPFRIEHLSGAYSTPKNGLTASFEQEIELAPNKFQKVLAVITRKGKDSEPAFTISSMEYSKYNKR